MHAHWSTSSCIASLYDGSRRRFLNRFGMGLGGLGLATMLSESRQANAETRSPLASKLPHFAARARRVIHIFCAGGPSHVDTWDPKPALEEWEGKTIPILGASPLPSPFHTEMDLALAFLQRYSPGQQQTGVVRLAHALLQTSEAIYVR